jgi:uncharacterized protein (TIGR03067 family)
VICHAALAGLSIVVCVTAKSDEPKAGDLEGTWVITSVIYEGEDAKWTGGVWFNFTGNKVRVVTFGADDSGTFVTNPKANPATIDFKADTWMSTVGKGIYKVENDTLTLCTARDGGERPKEFKAAKDNVLITLKRMKE